MIRVENSVVVHATREQVFAFIDRPEHQMWIPLGPTRFTRVKRLSGGGVSARFSFPMAGLSFHGGLLTTEYVPGERTVLILDGPLKGLVWWLLTPEGQETLLTCGAEYELPPTLLGGVCESYFQSHGGRGLDAALARLQRRLSPAPAPEPDALLLTPALPRPRLRPRGKS